MIFISQGESESLKTTEIQTKCSIFNPTVFSIWITVQHKRALMDLVVIFNHNGRFKIMLIQILPGADIF